MKTSGRVRLKLRSRNFYKKGENFKRKPINFTDKINFVIKCIIFLKNLIKTDCINKKSNNYKKTANN